MLITRRDPDTEEINTYDLSVSDSQMTTWNAGAISKEVFAHLTEEERTFIIKGTTIKDSVKNDAL